MKIMNTTVVTFVILLVVMAVTVAMVSAAPTADDDDVCEDRIPGLCSEQIQPHHCYLELNRNLCCRTCMGFKTDDSDCPYGDHYAKIRTNTDGVKTSYNCKDYVGAFGRHHCQEASFRSYCCKTCK